MSEPAADPLKELLQRELEKLAADAAASPGDSLPAERIQTLSSLAKLIETQDSLRPKRRSWWPAVVFLSTLAVASVLLFVRVGETEIELDAALSEISFLSGKAEVLTQTANLNALGITGLQDMKLPGVSDLIPAGRHPHVVSFTALSGGSSGITLEPLFVPPRTRVTVAQSEMPNQYRLSVRSRDLPVQATLFGQVTPAVPGIPVKNLNASIPRQVSLRGSGDVTLSLMFPSLPQSPVSPLLEVTDIAFLRVDQFSNSEQESVRRISTILSGTLSLESLNSQEIRLRPGEELQFERSQAEIRSLEMNPNHVNVKLRAKVSGMTLGTGEAHRSIMPTYLEWVRARHSAGLLWGTSLYLFGIAAAVLRWWGLRSLL
jgi:hypothetical protein